MFSRKWADTFYQDISNDDVPDKKALFSILPFYMYFPQKLSKDVFQEQHLNLHSIYYMQKFMFVCENLLHTHSSTTSFLLSSSQPPRISPLYHRNNPPNKHNQTKNPRGQQHDSKGDCHLEEVNLKSRFLSLLRVIKLLCRQSERSDRDNKVCGKEWPKHLAMGFRRKCHLQSWKNENSVFTRNPNNSHLQYC